MKRLSMFLLGLVFVGLAAFATPFHPLSNYASFQSIEILGHETLPIEAYPGETLSIKGTFQAPENMSAAKVRCNLVMGGFYRILVYEADAKLTNGSFPVNAGQELTVYFDVPIAPIFPHNLEMDLEITIDDIISIPVVGASLNFMIKS